MQATHEPEFLIRGQMESIEQGPSQTNQNNFSSLPRANDPFFRQLWLDKRLKFIGSDGGADDIDIYSAQLICASLTRQQSMLLVLPDHAPRRMPLLFVTGLIMHSLDNIGKSSSHQVIYFGTSASIKNYLTETYIRDQQLSSIFQQTNIGYSNKSKSEISSSLPKVIFSYSPTNAEKIFETYNPKWVFIDCGDGTKIEWVNSLLTKLSEKKIVGIACVQNPLSQLSEEAQNFGWNIFSWALSPYEDFSKKTRILPYLIGGQQTLAQSQKFRNANSILSELSPKISGRLQNDARRAVGRYVNSLENLMVPLDFFEAESKYYWGISSIQSLRQTAEHFSSAIQEKEFHNALENVLQDAIFIHEHYKNNSPPFWLALEQICIDTPKPDDVTLLIFQNRTYHQIFSLAMLAKNNIAEHELQGLDIWLTHLKQYNQWQNLLSINRKKTEIEDIPSVLKENSQRLFPLLIGVPTKYNYARYANILQRDVMGNLLLPHLFYLAKWHYKQWLARFDQIIIQNKNTISRLVTISVPTPTIDDDFQSERIIIEPETEIVVDHKTELENERLKRFLEFASKTEEISLLMDEFSIMENSTVLDINTTSDEVGDTDGSFVEKAIILRFKENFEVIFSPTDKIQAVVEINNRKILQERSVRSLRQGDVVLFINGQQRQSLYDLIISRVHDHSTFSIHISLIERWQDELIACYVKANKSVSEILAEMQKKGSKLQTETAIRFWLWKKVMCPDDARDLKRISEILDMPFVKQYHSQIDRAATRLRGIHISLARKLNAWLEKEAFSSSSSSFNDIVDSELGLDFRDFREALMLLTVKSITEEHGLFLLTDLGQIRNTSE